MKLILASHLLCTVGMFGVIWIIQLVHYPLFDRVAREGFAAFEADHSRQITWVVGPLMLGELATAVLLAFRLSSHPTAWVWWTGLVMVGLLWLSTAALSIPEHSRLGNGWNADAHRRLVMTNWPRTLLWTARSVLALYGTFAIVRLAEDVS